MHAMSVFCVSQKKLGGRGKGTFVDAYFVRVHECVCVM